MKSLVFYFMLMLMNLACIGLDIYLHNYVLIITNFLASVMCLNKLINSKK
jgi:hypothetical protein